MAVKIIGTGRALPNTIVTNDDLSKLMDTNDEWISSRTGIRRRYLVNGEESGVTLGAAAARRAMEQAGVKGEEIDMILVATCTAESHFPSVGCQIQAEIGAVDSVAFDISAACSGFLFALHTAEAYLNTGNYKNILVVGTETLSRVIDWEDRSTCVLFGDGAGACVVQKSDTGIFSYVQHSDGSQGGVLTCQGAAMKTPVTEKARQMSPLAMDGQGVFKFAVKTVPICIKEALCKAGEKESQVKYFLLHQANRRIIQSVAKRLGISEDRFPMNLDTHGNTSAASIPILLDEMNRAGKLERGDLLVLSGFGAGLTWGATVFTW